MKPQRYVLKKVGELRDKLFASGYLNSYIGKKLNNEQLISFVGDLAVELRDKVAFKILYDSCAYLLNVDLSPEELFTLCWRLAGNYKKLLDNEPVTPWQFQMRDEWMPVQFVSAKKKRSEKGYERVVFSLRILAGSACPTLFTAEYSSKFCYRLAVELGFSKSYGKLPYADYREFCGLRGKALFKVTEELGSPVAARIVASPSQLSNNKKLIKARRRIFSVCPQRRTCDCLNCPVGQDQCVLALRARTLQKKICRRCGKTEWTDVTQSFVCVECSKSAGEFFKF